MSAGPAQLSVWRISPTLGELAGRPPSLTARAAFTVGACVIVGTGAGLGIRTGVAAVLAIAATLVVLRRPELGALALVAVVPVASGLRPGLPVPGLRISEVMIGGVAIIILLRAKPGQTPPWRGFDWLALGYVVANAALGSYDLVSRHAGLHLGDASKLLGPLQFFLLYRAVLTTLTTPRRQRMAMRLILMASVPVSMLALMQQAHVLGVPSFLADITGSTAYTANISRATGPFAHWHDLGAYLFVVILLGVGLLSMGSGRVMSRRLTFAIVVLAVIGVVSTVSFTPIVGVLIGSLVLVGTTGGAHRRRRIFALAALTAAVALAFAPLLEGRYREQLTSNNAAAAVPYLPKNFNFRIEVWRTEYVPVLEKHFVSGYGPATPPGLAFGYTESVYVTLLLRGGLVLLLFYAGLMVALARQARQATDAPDPDQRAVARVIRVVIVLIVFMQLTTNYFVNSGFPHLFWLLAAIMAAASWRAARGPEHSPGLQPRPHARRWSWPTVRGPGAGAAP